MVFAQVDDLPKLWNESMDKYLGVVPPNNKEGVLQVRQPPIKRPLCWHGNAGAYTQPQSSEPSAPHQDVHWPSGAVGYFPSYSLGAMMATQIFEAASKELPGLESSIVAGEFSPLRKWLNE